MLRWALLCLILGLIAGGLGFWQLEDTAMHIPTALGTVFVIVSPVSLGMQHSRRFEQSLTGLQPIPPRLP